MAISITLTDTVKTTDKGTVSITFTSTCYGLSSKIFAIEVLPKAADFEAPNYRFSHVCSPSELVEFPEDVPGDCCYFRTDSIELVFDDDVFVKHVVDNMRADAKKLCDELMALDDADGITETVTFGNI